MSNYYLIKKNPNKRIINFMSIVKNVALTTLAYLIAFMISLYAWT